MSKIVVQEQEVSISRYIGDARIQFRESSNASTQFMFPSKAQLSSVTRRMALKNDLGK